MIHSSLERNHQSSLQCLHRRVNVTPRVGVRLSPSRSHLPLDPTKCAFQEESATPRPNPRTLHQTPKLGGALESSRLLTSWFRVSETLRSTSTRRLPSRCRRADLPRMFLKALASKLVSRSSIPDCTADSNMNLRIVLLTCSEASSSVVDS